MTKATALNREEETVDGIRDEPALVGNIIRVAIILGYSLLIGAAVYSVISIYGELRPDSAIERAVRTKGAAGGAVNSGASARPGRSGLPSGPSMGPSPDVDRRGVDD